MGLFSKRQEEKVIRAAAAGDRSAAERLIKAHQVGLFTYLFRLSGRRDLAEDIVQEAFIRVLTNLDRFDHSYRFSTWLFTIARRIYLNDAAKKRPVLDGGGMLDSRRVDVDPETPLERRESTSIARSGLDAALSQLSEDQREIVVLFHQFDWPLAVIAEHMDMPVGTVKSHLHRARLRLREILRAVEPAPEPRATALGSGLRIVRSIVTRRHGVPGATARSQAPADSGISEHHQGRDPFRGGHSS